jgi:hypothetical protein
VGIHSCEMFNRVDWEDFGHNAKTPTGNKAPIMNFFFSVSINEILIKIYLILIETRPYNEFLFLCEHK